LIVGYPLISTPSISFPVASHLAIVNPLTFLAFSAAFKYSGANYLQCPHHGA